MIMQVYHVLIIGCVVYTLCPISACSCIGHASHMHTRCTFAAHILTLDMFCIHSHQLILFRPLADIICSCVLVVPWSTSLFHHPQHIMFSLCFVAFFKICFCLLFELHFLIHLAPLTHHYPCSHLLLFLSVLLIHFSICDKKWRVY